jgi:Integrase core domain
VQQREILDRISEHYAIDHTRTKTKSSQTNGICERFHQTIQNEFYASAFRRKLYRALDELQADVDEWVESYNAERTHTGKYCYGKTPHNLFCLNNSLVFGVFDPCFKSRLDHCSEILEANFSSYPVRRCSARRTCIV